ncbi:MAG: VOC family protein [Caulobacterales bacterium]
MIRVVLTSIPVNDQAKAEKFYTEKLGFVVKQKVPVHGMFWLTVVPPDEPNAPELVLEPQGFEAAQVYYKHLYDNKIPCTALGCDNVQAEYDRLTKLGVTFLAPPTPGGEFPANAVFDDTCGNYVMISEPPPA